MWILVSLFFFPIWVYSFVCGFRFWPILFAILRFWMHFFFGFGFSSILQCPLHQLYNFGQFCVCGVIRLQLALETFKARSTETVMNRDTTSKDTISSSGLTVWVCTKFEVRGVWNMIPRVPQVESAIRQKNTYGIHPRYGEILERNETNYTQRIFLES